MNGGSTQGRSQQENYFVSTIDIGGHFQPLDHLANGLVRVVGNKDMNMVAPYFATQNMYIVLHSYLAYQVAHTNGHRPCKYFLTILGYPH